LHPAHVAHVRVVAGTVHVGIRLFALFQVMESVEISRRGRLCGMEARDGGRGVVTRLGRRLGGGWRPIGEAGRETTSRSRSPWAGQRRRTHWSAWIRRVCASLFLVRNFAPGG